MIAPQKAKHLYLEAEKKNPHYEGKDYMVFEKHDGWYGFMDPNDAIRSRNLRPIPSMDWLAKELEGLEGRLIFEIMVHGLVEFKDVNGMLNRHAACPDAYIRVHDYLVPGDLAFAARYKAAEEIVSKLNHDSVWMANYLGIAGEQDWQRMAEEQWELGAEGIVMKEVFHKYAAGSRIGSLLKIKEDLTLDLMVIDVIEGEGKYEGMLGALKVFEASGKEHTIAGMTDYERAEWWKNPALIVGHVVEVKAMKRLSNNSLREPRFKAIRHDKGIEDID